MKFTRQNWNQQHGKALLLLHFCLSGSVSFILIFSFWCDIEDSTPRMLALTSNSWPPGGFAFSTVSRYPYKPSFGTWRYLEWENPKRIPSVLLEMLPSPFWPEQMDLLQMLLKLKHKWSLILNQAGVAAKCHGDVREMDMTKSNWNESLYHKMVCEPTWAQLLSWNNRPPEVTHRPWQWMVGRQASPFRKVTFQGRTVKRWWFMARMHWDVRSLYQPRSNVKTKSTADPAIFDAWMWPRWWGSAGHVRVSQFFFLADLGVAVVNMETLQGFVAFHQKPLEMPWFLLMDQFWRWIRLV